MEWLWIMIGGALGAFSRYSVGDAVESFAFATFIVNMIGCFFLGLVNQISSLLQNNKWLKYGIGVGFLGSFTTFSTFSVDFFRLLERSLLQSFTYLFASISIGIFVAFFGLKVGKYFVRRGEKG